MARLQEHSSRLLHVIRVINLGVVCAYYLSLLILALDRLFAVSYPAHKSLFKVKKIYFAMVVCRISVLDVNDRGIHNLTSVAGELYYRSFGLHIFGFSC